MNTVFRPKQPPPSSFSLCLHDSLSLLSLVTSMPAMTSSAPKQPQRLSEALEQHYQQLLAETQTKPASSASSIPYSSARLSPTSTSSTASESSTSDVQSTSPSLTPRLSNSRLTGLDDDTDEDDSSSSAADSSSASSASSKASASSRPVLSSRLPLPLPTARVDSLLTLCTLHLASHLDSVSSLARLPEEVVQQLLYLTIMRSGMTTQLAKLFAASGHDSVVTWVEENLDLSAVYMTSTQSCRERF